MARTSDKATFYWVIDGELVDASVGVDDFGTGLSPLHFQDGKFTTDNEELIVQLQNFADTASHPVSTQSPRTASPPAKKEGP